jgi:hypothetical protein
VGRRRSSPPTDVARLPTAANHGVIRVSSSFVDGANRDYHLRGNAAGGDFAAPSSVLDLDGAPSPVGLPQIANGFGPTDLGVYEPQTALTCDASPDALFCDGFGPCSHRATSLLPCPGRARRSLARSK